MNTKILRPIVLVLLFSLVPPMAETQVIRHLLTSVDAENEWDAVSERQNIRMIERAQAPSILTLNDAEYSLHDMTDALFHFDSAPIYDSASHYEVVSGEMQISTWQKKRGEGAAYFRQSTPNLILRADDRSLFSPGALWDDFSIEFWLYAVNGSYSEEIIAWDGAAPTEAGALAQSMRVNITARGLEWNLSRMFYDTDDEYRSVTLTGRRSLPVHQWQHHQLRYSHRRGLLEYRIDNLPVAVAYMTDSGHERGSPFIVRIGEYSRSDITLGRNFIGFIDEFRIMSRSVADPLLHQVNEAGGSIETRVFDLEKLFTQQDIPRSFGALQENLLIDVRFHRPADSRIEFLYQFTENLSEIYSWESTWSTFVPNEPLPSVPNGRYLRIRLELFPDSTLSLSPAITAIQVRYTL